MNLPTKLTVTRMVLTPLYLVVFFLPFWFGTDSSLPILNKVSALFLILLFIICEFTDFLDGYIARKYNLVTDLGKLLDPFSDVLIRITYFLGFSYIGFMPIWAFALILYREFGILFVRMLSIKRGIVVPANIWGKGKAVLYAVSTVVGLLFLFFDRFFWAGEISLDIMKRVDATDLTVFKSIVMTYGVPSMQGLFILSAVVSLVSFFTYLVPFIRIIKEDS